eukprot:123609-Chlamydomonas_euryale.AAC.8
MGAFPLVAAHLRGVVGCRARQRRARAVEHPWDSKQQRIVRDLAEHDRCLFKWRCAIQCSADRTVVK